MMGTPSPSGFSSSAVDASMSTHGVRGDDFISRSTCFSLDATESLDQLSRQEPSSSAETTDAARTSVSAGSVSTMPASRGWQMPWNRAASTSRAESSLSVCRMIS